MQLSVKITKFLKMTMGSRRRRGSELRVKEVILPVRSEQRDAGCSGYVRKDHEVYSSTDVTHTSVKLGEREITVFCGLVVLEKPPVEDYFKGNRKKKSKRKKSRRCEHPKKDHSLHEVIHSEAQNLTDVPLTNESLEEKLLRGNIDRRIRAYEKQTKQEQEKNYRRQRLLEEQSMEQQENLVQTWLSFIQRKEELRKKDSEENFLPTSRRPCNRPCYSRPVNISLLSKKYWKDARGEKTQRKALKPEKRKEKEEEKKPVATVRDLGDELLEKLVFVDDSDDDFDKARPVR